MATSSRTSRGAPATGAGWATQDRGLLPATRAAVVVALVVAGATVAPALVVAVVLRGLWQAAGARDATGHKGRRGPSGVSLLGMVLPVLLAFVAVSLADGRAAGAGPTELLFAGAPPGTVLRGALAVSFGYVDALVRSLRDTRGTDAFAPWGDAPTFARAYLGDVWRGALLLGAPAALLWTLWDRLRVGRRATAVDLTPEERHAQVPAFPAAVVRKAAQGTLEHDAPLGWPPFPLGWPLSRMTRRVPGHPADGLCVAYTQTGAPFPLGWDTINRGGMVTGTNGSGKSNLLSVLLYGAAQRGHPCLLVDFKGDTELLAEVERLGGVAWSFDRPSPRWNPLQGTASEVAEKVTAVEGTQTGNQWNTVTAGYVQLAVRALLEAGVAPEPTALAALLNPQELQTFLTHQERQRRLTPQRAVALRHEVALTTDKEAGFDVRPLGGVASRMRGILHGTPADWLGQAAPGEPYLDVLEAIRAGRLVLFSINATANGLPARRIGAWVLAEAKRVSTSLGTAWGREHRCLYLVDEFSSLEEYGRDVANVLAVARGNGIGVYLFTQGYTRFKTQLGPDSAGIVTDALGNCNTLVVLRQPEPADTAAWSERLGTYQLQDFNQSLDPETGEGAGPVRHKMVTTPYATPGAILALPDYHAFVKRPGDSAPTLVRLVRAVPPPTPDEVRPVSVWGAPVVRWPVPAVLAEVTPAAGVVPPDAPDAGAEVRTSRDTTREPSRESAPGNTAPTPRARFLRAKPG